MTKSNTATDTKNVTDNADNDGVGAEDNVTDTTESKKFYNIFDGTHGRVNSRYLDMDERIDAERTRAMAEDREPDLSDLGALLPSVGTPAVVWEQLPDNRYYSNPATLTVETATGKRKDVDPVLTADVSTGKLKNENEDDETDKADKADNKVSSDDDDSIDALVGKPLVSGKTH